MQEKEGQGKSSIIRDSVLSTNTLQCDESPNGCGACFKRRARCSLKPSTPPPLSLPTPKTPLPSSPNQNLSTPFPASTLIDLELLHNFIAKTCGTMTKHHHFYQTDFVSEAFKCDYVLHCLLGLSAFHLVQQNQELLQNAPAEQQPYISSKIEDYLLAAHFHQNAGLSTFRQELTDVSISIPQSTFPYSRYLQSLLSHAYLG